MVPSTDILCFRALDKSDDHILVAVVHPDWLSGLRIAENPRLQCWCSPHTNSEELFAEKIKNTFPNRKVHFVNTIVLVPSEYFGYEIAAIDISEEGYRGDTYGDPKW